MIGVRVKVLQVLVPQQPGGEGLCAGNALERGGERASSCGQVYVGCGQPADSQEAALPRRLLPPPLQASYTAGVTAAGGSHG